MLLNYLHFFSNSSADPCAISKLAFDTDFTNTEACKWSSASYPGVVLVVHNPITARVHWVRRPSLYGHRGLSFLSLYPRVSPHDFQLVAFALGTPLVCYSRRREWLPLEAFPWRRLGILIIGEKGWRAYKLVHVWRHHADCMASIVAFHVEAESLVAFHPGDLDVMLVVISGSLYLFGLKTSKLLVVGELMRSDSPLCPFLIPQDVKPSSPLHCFRHLDFYKYHYCCVNVHSLDM